MKQKKASKKPPGAKTKRAARAGFGVQNVIDQPAAAACVPCYPPDNRILAVGRVNGIPSTDSLAHVFAKIYQASAPSPPPTVWPADARMGSANSGGSWRYFSDGSASYYVPGARSNCGTDYLFVWAVLAGGSIVRASVDFRAYPAAVGSSICTQTVQLPLFEIAPRHYELTVQTVKEANSRSAGKRSKGSARDILLNHASVTLSHDVYSPLTEPVWRTSDPEQPGNKWQLQVAQVNGEQVAVAEWFPPPELGLSSSQWITRNWKFDGQNTLGALPDSKDWTRGLTIVLNRRSCG